MTESRTRFFSKLASNIDSSGDVTAEAIAAGVSLGGGATTTISDSIGSLPVNADAGSFYYLTGTGKLYVYTGSAWGAIDTTATPVDPNPTNISPYFNGNFHKQYVASPYGSTITFNARAIDAEGDSLTYDYLLSDPDGVIRSISNTGSNFTILTDSTLTSPATATVTLRVNDGNTYDTEDIKINLSFALANVANLDMGQLNAFGTTKIDPDFKHQALTFTAWYKQDGTTSTTSNDFGEDVCLWHRDSNQYDIIVGANRMDSVTITDVGFAMHLRKAGPNGSWGEGRNQSSTTLNNMAYWTTFGPVTNYGQRLSHDDFEREFDISIDAPRNFGFATAADGDYVAIGTGSGFYSASANEGMVYIYKDSAGQLVPQTILRDPVYWNGTSRNTSQEFGSNVSLHNNKLATYSNEQDPAGGGAPVGRIYFYEKGAGLDWDSNGALWLGHRASNQHMPIALMDNWCIIGMPFQSTPTYDNIGQIKVFKESAGEWFEHSVLDHYSTDLNAAGYSNVNGNASSNVYFGSGADLDTSVDPPRIAAGMWGYNSNAGGVQFFSYNADEDKWYRDNAIVASGTSYFGRQLSLSKNLIAIGAPGYVSSTNYGAVALYEYSSEGGWVLQKYQTGNSVYTPISGDYWPNINNGKGIDLVNNHMVIGWERYDGNDGRIDIVEFNYDSGPLL